MLLLDDDDNNGDNDGETGDVQPLGQTSYYYMVIEIAATSVTISIANQERREYMHTRQSECFRSHFFILIVLQATFDLLNCSHT
jgi:hypothetical protein